MDELVGTIKLFAGRYQPNGYIYCHGQILRTLDYQALFAVIGSRFGGDGKLTFAVPDLRSLEPPEEWGLKYVICYNGMFPLYDF